MAQVPAHRTFGQHFQAPSETLFRGWPAPSGQDPGQNPVWDFEVREDDKKVVVRAEGPGPPVQEGPTPV
jgi:hypothetical protein